MSRNGLFNATIGGRGTGKTFDYKNWALHKPSQTVWVRRMAEDLKEFSRKFFPDLLSEGYVTDEDTFSIKNNVITFNGEDKIFLVPLNAGRRFKSSSFAGVGDIIFDEFIDENNSYLDHEIDRFFSLYETVNRLRIDRPEVRVFFIGNKVNFQNPYFSFWKIRPFEGRFKKFMDGAVVVENYSNPTYEKLKKNTRSFKAMSRSAYTRSMVDNTSWLDSNAYIKAKDPKATLYCNIRFRDVTFGLWAAKAPRGYYCARANNPEELTFAAPIYTAEEGEVPLKPKSTAFEILSLAHDNSFLYFEDNELKDIVISILQGGYKE